MADAVRRRSSCSPIFMYPGELESVLYSVCIRVTVTDLPILSFLAESALAVPQSDRYYPAEGEFFDGRTDSLR